MTCGAIRFANVLSMVKHCAECFQRRERSERSRDGVGVAYGADRVVLVRKLLDVAAGTGQMSGELRSGAVVVPFMA